MGDSMRKLLMVILLVGIGAETFASLRPLSAPPRRVDTNFLTQDDRFVPWPWSVRKTFPWAMMEGTWLAQNGRFQSYYTFKITREAQNRRFEVRQIDIMTCKEVAFGQGSAVRTQNSLVADMFYLNVRQSYGIYVRSFDYAGSTEDINVSPINGQVVLLSIQPEGRDEYVHLGISKLSNDSAAAFCKGKNEANGLRRK